MAERNNTPPRMTALGLLEQMRRANAANREPEFNPINAMRERRAGPTAPLFGGQRQPPLPIPPRPPAVIPPPPPQRAAPQAAAAPQVVPSQAAAAPPVRGPRQPPLPIPPIPPQLDAEGNPIYTPPALLPQVPGAPRLAMHERFNPENPYVATATQMAERYGLPPNVLLSLIQRESRFRPDAVSRVGALGLGQLMPGTARDLRVDPLDPTENIEGSARYLRQQLDRFGGDMTLALAAYNAGPRRVAEAGNTIPNNAETRAYVPGVMRNAGVPGYAEGGLAHLEQKYSEGGSVTSLPTYDIDVRATRIPRRRAPRPTPREELTADQLNGMVLDILARRAAAEPEAGAAAEARDRIGRTMGYAKGGLAELEHKYEGGGRVMSDWSRYLPEDMPDTAFNDLQQTMTYRPLNVRRLIDAGAIRITQPGSGVGPHAADTPDPERYSLVTRYNDRGPDSYTRAWATKPESYESAIEALNQPGFLYDGKYRQILQSARELGLSPDEVFLPERENRAEGGLADLHQRYAEGGRVMSDEEYDRRLLGRMQRDIGRTDVPNWDEQRATLVDAAGRAARGVFDVVVPQTPLDVGLTLATGPVGSMARRGAIAGAGYLLDPDEAQANVIRRVGRALGRAGAGSADTAIEAAATPTAPTRRRGTIGIIPEETAPAARVTQDVEGYRPNIDPVTGRAILPAAEDLLAAPRSDFPYLDVPQPSNARQNQALLAEQQNMTPGTGNTYSGNMDPLVNERVIFRGREPREWSPSDWGAYGRQYGTDRLGPVDDAAWQSSLREYDAGGGQRISIPGGLETDAPYGHLAQKLHRQNVETIRSPEGWDLFRNPKPPSFAENLSGNQRPGTMDAHALSVPSILSRDPRFLTTDLRIPSGGDYFNLKPRASYGRGVFTIDEAVRRPQLWDAAPNPNEYAALERRFRRLGEDLDMTTAQAQASGWVGGGRISGLTSPPLPAVDVFQRVVNRTAAQEGRSPQEVLRGFIHRQNALRAAAPVAIGVGANEELDGYAHGGIAQLHRKYAEGGAVSAQPAIYDPDAVNALANQIEADYV